MNEVVKTYFFGAVLRMGWWALSVEAIFVGRSLNVLALDTTVAHIGSHTISDTELEKKVAQVALQSKPYLPEKKQILKILAYQKAGSEYARQQGLLNEKAFQEKQELLLYEHLIEKYLEKGIQNFQPSSEELKRYYEKNPAIRIRHFFIPVFSEASSAYQKEAHNQIRTIAALVQKNRNLAGWSFGELIQKESRGPDALTGGDFGYRLPSQLDPALYRAALSLKENEISGIVRSRFGWHILQRLSTHSFEEVSLTLVQQEMWLDRREDLIRELHQKIENAIPIRISAF